MKRSSYATAGMTSSQRQAKAKAKFLAKHPERLGAQAQQDVDGRAADGKPKETDK